MDELIITRFLRENLVVRISKEYGSYSVPDALHINISIGDEIITEDYIDIEDITTSYD
jgi:hypothetical protein